MTGHRIKVSGFKLKDGKLVRDERRLDVSKRLQRRKSKRVRIDRRPKDLRPKDLRSC